MRSRNATTDDIIGLLLLHDLVMLPSIE